jgi:hypothetical protein
MSDTEEVEFQMSAELIATLREVMNAIICSRGTLHKLFKGGWPIEVLGALPQVSAQPLLTREEVEFRTSGNQHQNPRS